MKRIGCKGLCWLLTLLSLACLFGCAGEGSPTPEATQAAVTWDTLEFDRSMELLYADQFSVDYDQGGYAKLTIGDADTYLVVPEGAAVPSGLPEGVTVLQQPLDSVYLVATSAMDLFRELDAMDAIRLSGTDASGWYIQEAKQAMEEGRMTYAGKYSAPDYELILASGCDLAVESTMIYHTPEVKEQLEKLGIPVLVERSSYESHPIRSAGRSGSSSMPSSWERRRRPRLFLTARWRSSSPFWARRIREKLWPSSTSPPTVR